MIGEHPAGPRAASRARRRGRYRARVDDRGGRVRGVRPGGPGCWQRAARRAGPRRASWPTATRRRRPSWPRRTPAPAAPTSTAARCSASGGASSPAGASWSARRASCAAMAMTFAAYAVPDGWQRPVAAAVVVVLALVNCAGITRTAGLTRVIVALVLLALAVAVAACFGGGNAVEPGRLGLAARRLRRPPVGRAVVLRVRRLRADRHPRRGGARAGAGDPTRDRGRPGRSPSSCTPSSGSPCCACSVRTRPRPPPRPSPTRSRAGAWDWAVPVVRVGAALAAAGALLALVAGLGRTSLAMAREGDLPRWLDAVHPRFQVPHRAELSVAAVVVVLVLVADLRGVIGFSSFGVLLYYFVANAAAHAPGPEHRRFPRWLQLARVRRAASCSSSRCRGRRSCAGVAVFAGRGRWCGWCACARSPTVEACWSQRRPSTASPP